MTALRAGAPGKVNLCLLLGGPRPDGLHELVSLLESVSLADEVTIEPAPAGSREDQLVCPGVAGPNLAARALADFRRATGWDAPPQRVSVFKRIPVAGGMGGASADAAATLRLAARAAGHDAVNVLAGLAPGLGADVPALLQPGAALVTGAGEDVRYLPPLPPHALLVLPADERLATPAVFAEADRLGLARSPEDLAARRCEVERAVSEGGWPPAELVRNDLEAAARSLCPAIDSALEAAAAGGAEHTLVSGSGPTVIGLFVGAEAIRRAAAAQEDLAARFPAATVAVPVDAAFGSPQGVEDGS